MVRTILTVVALAVVLTAGAAVAGELEGTIRSIDTAERTVVLDNGTKLWLGDGVAADSLKEGAEVRVSFEERDGKTVATRIEVK